MDWLQFFSSLAGSLAWPVSAFAIVCVFRKSIVGLLPGLQKLSLPGVQAEFRERLSEVAAVAAVTPVSAHMAITEQDDILVADVNVTEGPGKATQISDITGEIRYSVREHPLEYEVTANEDSLALRANPTGVIMESWKILESAIRSLDAGPSSHSERAGTLRPPIGIILRALAHNRKIASAENDMVKQLFEMRNLAAHSDQKIPPEDARKFEMLAKSLANAFRERCNSAAE